MDPFHILLIGALLTLSALVAAVMIAVDLILRAAFKQRGHK